MNEIVLHMMSQNPNYNRTYELCYRIINNVTELKIIFQGRG